MTNTALFKFFLNLADFHQSWLLNFCALSQHFAKLKSEYMRTIFVNFCFRLLTHILRFTFCLSLFKEMVTKCKITLNFCRCSFSHCFARLKFAHKCKCKLCSVPYLEPHVSLTVCYYIPAVQASMNHYQLREEKNWLNALVELSERS